MPTLIAYGTFVLAVTMAVSRPRVREGWHLGPAHAGALATLTLVLFGVVTPQQIGALFFELWQPFATIAGLMVLTAAAEQVGLLDRVAAVFFSKDGLSAAGLFDRVFIAAVVTSSVLNNDASILLLTPVVLAVCKARLPDRPDLLPLFAFAVFTAVGVAPLMVSNPMNMVVAGYAGVGFNEYASWMAPIAAAGWILAFAILRSMARGPLTTAPALRPIRTAGGWTGGQIAMTALLFGVLCSYPLVSFFVGGSIWLVAVAGSVIGMLILRASGKASVAEVLTKGVAWEVIVFVSGAFVIALGLRNVGLVEQLADLYAGASAAKIGAVSALGSSLLNNHPMAIVNLLALEMRPDAGQREIFAILIGGDLGPRLLPVGSLAGLLWLEICRRAGVQITLGQFVRIGVAVTVPTLALSLLLLQIR